MKIIQLIPGTGWQGFLIGAPLREGDRARERTYRLVAWALTDEGEIVPLGLDGNDVKSLHAIADEACAKEPATGWELFIEPAPEVPADADDDD